MINTFKQVRFFLVAAALVSVFASAAFAVDDVYASGDPNKYTGAGGFVADAAATTNPPVWTEEGCAECQANRDGVRRGRVANPRGGVAGAGGAEESADQ